MPSANPKGVAVHGSAYHTDVERYVFFKPTPYNGAGGAWSTDGRHPNYRLATTKNEIAYVRAKLPSDFVSLTSVKIVWYGIGGAAGQDWRMTVKTAYASVGETRFTHLDDPAMQVLDVTVPLIIYETVQAGILTNAIKGDWIGISINRQGLEAEDTYAGSIEIIGVLITYTAEQ